MALAVAFAAAVGPVVAGAVAAWLTDSRAMGFVFAGAGAILTTLWLQPLLVYGSAGSKMLGAKTGGTGVEPASGTEEFHAEAWSAPRPASAPGHEPVRPQASAHPWEDASAAGSPARRDDPPPPPARPPDVPAAKTPRPGTSGPSPGYGGLAPPAGKADPHLLAITKSAHGQGIARTAIEPEGGGYVALGRFLALARLARENGARIPTGTAVTVQGVDSHLVYVDAPGSTYDTGPGGGYTPGPEGGSS